MSKRTRLLSPVTQPPTKRQRLSKEVSKRTLTFDSALVDELVLTIFASLEAVDLCRAQRVNKTWARLATDNQLWRQLFLREHGRERLKGTKSLGMTIGTSLSRPLKPLPTRIERCVEQDGRSLPVAWKFMYRIASNWRRGRSVSHSTLLLQSSGEWPSVQQQHNLFVAGSTLVVSPGVTASLPAVTIHSAGKQLLVRPTTSFGTESIRVSTFALNQAGLSGKEVQIAVFYARENQAHHISIFGITSGLQRARGLKEHRPQANHGYATHAAFHSSLLVALSSTFQLEMYQVTEDTIQPLRTMTSFSSFPPSSLTLCRTQSLYKILLSYAVPIYPQHWSVATTELSVREGEDKVMSRTIRVFNPMTATWESIPPSERVQSESGSPPRYGAKMASVAAVETDGRWLVVAPSDDNLMEVYRIKQNRLLHSRTLLGPHHATVGLAVSEGRCVSVSRDGVAWVWDLECGWGVKVQSEPFLEGVVEPGARVVFDERQIAVGCNGRVMFVRFDE